MKQRESLEIRKEMVEMHEAYLDRLKTAMDTKQFVEATWICYAIYEQRINRIIEKILPKCPIETPRTSNNSASISTRIKCLEKLISKSYGGLAKFDLSLLNDISAWCDDRNRLVHDLVNLDEYNRFDADFETLAKQGVPLVNRIYEEGTKFRQWFVAADSLPDFPTKHKCRCKKEQCIKP